MKTKHLLLLLALMGTLYGFSQEPKMPWKLGVPEIKGKVKSLTESKDTSFIDSANSKKDFYRRIYYFDDKGLCTSSSKYLRDEVVMTTTYTYSKSGKCIDEASDRIKGNERKEMWHSSYDYDSKDSLRKLTHIYPHQSKTIIEYNKYGDIIEDLHYSMKDTTHFSVTSIIKFNNHYQKSHLIHMEEIRGDTLFSIQDYTYDSEGRLTQTLKTKQGGRVIGKQRYTYDSTGHTYEWWTTIDRSHIGIEYSTKYDNDNRVIKMVWYNKDGSARPPVAYEYKCDNAGNWIEERAIKEGKIIVILTRTIEYY